MRSQRVVRVLLFLEILDYISRLVRILINDYRLALHEQREDLLIRIIECVLHYLTTPFSTIIHVDTSLVTFDKCHAEVRRGKKACSMAISFEARERLINTLGNVITMRRKQSNRIECASVFSSE